MVKPNMKKIIFLKLETDKLFYVFGLKIVFKGKNFILYSIRGNTIYFVLFDTQTVSETRRLTRSRSDSAHAMVSHRHFHETQPITPHFMPLC